MPGGCHATDMTCSHQTANGPAMANSAQHAADVSCSHQTGGMPRHSRRWPARRLRPCARCSSQQNTCPCAKMASEAGRCTPQTATRHHHVGFCEVARSSALLPRAEPALPAKPPGPAVPAGRCCISRRARASAPWRRRNMTMRQTTSVQKKNLPTMMANRRNDERHGRWPCHEPFVPVLAPEASAKVLRHAGLHDRAILGQKRSQTFAGFPCTTRHHECIHDTR